MNYIKKTNSTNSVLLYNIHTI